MLFFFLFFLTSRKKWGGTVSIKSDTMLFIVIATLTHGNNKNFLHLKKRMNVHSFYICELFVIHAIWIYFRQVFYFRIYWKITWLNSLILKIIAFSSVEKRCFHSLGESWWPHTSFSPPKVWSSRWPIAVIISKSINYVWMNINNVN